MKKLKIEIERFPTGSYYVKINRPFETQEDWIKFRSKIENEDKDET